MDFSVKKGKATAVDVDATAAKQDIAKLKLRVGELLLAVVSQSLPSPSSQ